MLGWRLGLDRIVPDCIRSSQMNQPAVRNPMSTGPWQHVIEPLIEYLLLAQSLFLDKISPAVHLILVPL